LLLELLGVGGSIKVYLSFIYSSFQSLNYLSSSSSIGSMIVYLNYTPYWFS